MSRATITSSAFDPRDGPDNGLTVDKAQDVSVRRQAYFSLGMPIKVGRQNAVGNARLL